ncbi:hypothetical protein PMIN04_003733 [Paraphaeosphaeria minitans]
MEMRPELFFAALDQHLGHMQHPEERDVPVQQPRLVVMPRNVLPREKGLRGKARAQHHLAETKMRDAREECKPARQKPNVAPRSSLWMANLEWPSWSMREIMSLALVAPS